MTTTNIDVSTLPKKPGGKKKKWTTRTPQERIQVVERVDAAVAKGWTVKDACTNEGIWPSMYKKWTGSRKKWLGAAPAVKKMNGQVSGVDVCIMFKVRDNLVELSPEEARHVHARLTALLLD